MMTWRCRWGWVDGAWLGRWGVCWMAAELRSVDALARGVGIAGVMVSNADCPVSSPLCPLHALPTPCSALPLQVMLADRDFMLTKLEAADEHSEKLAFALERMRRKLAAATGVDPGEQWVVAQGGTQGVLFRRVIVCWPRLSSWPCERGVLNPPHPTPPHPNVDPQSPLTMAWMPAPRRRRGGSWR